MPVKLYMSSDGSVKGLQQLIDKQTKSNISTNVLKTWTGKLLDAAEKNKEIGDEEKEYIFGVSYLNGIMQLRKSKEFKNDPKSISCLPISTKLKSMMDRIECVKKSLEDRYEKNMADEENRKKSTLERIAAETAIAAELATKGTKEFEDFLTKCKISKAIEPSDLIKLLKDFNEDIEKLGGILLLDIRKRQEFNKNRILFPKKYSYHPSLVHIPIQNAVPGVIGSKLTKDSLSFEDYDKRQNFRLVIILSWKSSVIDLSGRDNNPIKCVNNALTKFDSKICKNVLVLCGGLFEWMSLYPHLMVDPTAGAPQAKFMSSSILENASRVSYEEARKIIDPPKPKVSPFKKPAPLKDISPKKSVITEEINSAEKRLLELERETATLQEEADKFNQSKPDTRKRIADLELAKAKAKQEIKEGMDRQERQSSLEKQTNGSIAPDVFEPSSPVLDSNGNIPTRPNAPKPVKKTAPTSPQKSPETTGSKPVANRTNKPVSGSVKNRPPSVDHPHKNRPPSVGTSFGLNENQSVLTPNIILPDDYQRKLDQNTNRYYFINHRDRTTSWSAPDGITPREAAKMPNVPDRGVTKPKLDRKISVNYDILSPAHGSGTHRGKTGLKNLGNSCYMNSILQSLASLKPLADHFLYDRYRKDVNQTNILGYKGQVAEEFGLVIKGLWEGTFRHFRPDSFKRTIAQCKGDFAGTKQQDAQELLIFLLDGLHEDLNKVKERRYIEEKDGNGRPDPEVATESWENHQRLNNSIIVDLFQGQFKSSLKCLSCRHTSTKFDAFMFLSMPIPSTGNPTLVQCLDYFQKTEKLSGSDKWTCSKCKKPRDAERTLQLWRVPPLLIIHLKRFKSEGRWKSKIQTNISYPLEGLDLRDYIKGPRKQPPYKLISVTNHQGASTDSGHYTAFCRRDKNWVKANDCEVSVCSPSGIVSSNGYILFYSSKPQDNDPGSDPKFLF